MNLQLDNHCALVTGSSRGTGQIIAQRLAQEGTTVLVHGLEPDQAALAIEQIGSGIPR